MIWNFAPTTKYTTIHDLIQQSLYTLWHWYSNLTYYSRNNLDTLDTQISSLLSYNWYNNPNDMILLTQNKLYHIWIDTTILCYDTWYKTQYTYMMILDTAISMLWYLIQQSHLLLYNNASASFLMPLRYPWYKTLISFILQLIQHPLYYDNLDITTTYSAIYYLTQHAIC